MVSISNISKTSLALVWILLTYVECYVSDLTVDVRQNVTFFSWIVVLNLIFQTLTLKWCRMSLVSFFYSFVVFYYIFHFGQVFMIGLFPDYQFDYLNYVEVYMTDDKLLDETVKLCIVSINAFFIGGLFASSGSKMKKSVKYINSVNTNYICVIRWIFFILLPFRVIVDLVQIVAAMYLGYYGAIHVTNMIPGVVASIGNMWYALVPIYYLVLNYRNKKIKYFIVILLYLAVTMLTGNRGHQIVCLASLAIVALASQEKINVKTLLKCVIGALIGMSFIDIIYSMRETSISQFLSNPVAFMESTNKSNIILETIGTFGETIYTPYLTIEGYNNQYHTWFGEAFVKSVVGVVPDIFGWFKELNKEAIFAKNLETESAIGGSFSAEMYYSFGDFYPLMSAFFGCIYCYLSNITYNSIKLKRYEHVIMAIAICSLALWWVRDSIGNLTRQVVWMYWMLLFFRKRLKCI